MKRSIRDSGEAVPDAGIPFAGNPDAPQSSAACRLPPVREGGNRVRRVFGNMQQFRMFPMKLFQWFLIFFAGMRRKAAGDLADLICRGLVGSFWVSGPMAMISLSLGWMTVEFSKMSVLEPSVNFHPSRRMPELPGLLMITLPVPGSSLGTGCLILRLFASLAKVISAIRRAPCSVGCSPSTYHSGWSESGCSASKRLTLYLRATAAISFPLPGGWRRSRCPSLHICVRPDSSCRGMPFC